MINWFPDHPGRIFVVGTLLPLAVFFLLLLFGGIRFLSRRYRSESSLSATIYKFCGGDRPSRWGAYLAVKGIVVSAILAIIGLIQFIQEAEQYSTKPEILESRWSERFDWVRLGLDDLKPAITLQIGYRIDHLTAILFTMVAFISSCIFVFSLGYMREETQQTLEDHEAHTPEGHFLREGRFQRFFLYLSLFCFSMLNLLIADNLFQVFISWELVGVCSFFLIGFYYERNSASIAANKAFIVNRVGDAGFLVGMAIIWSSFGTLNFQEIYSKLRCPEGDTHKSAPPRQMIGTVIRGDRVESDPDKVKLNPQGELVLLFPGHWHQQDLRKGTVFASIKDADPESDFVALPYTLYVIAGLGIFLGCVGKSAQFPLHTWLPDAMEGPTPVSALIHAATMVAAGVYLVGRSFPFFAPEVLLVIAYTGAITLFLGATIALVMTDIKRVLAYSTVSQLGYMMLALGVGGWAAGLLHLLTHAFFKALLFLCSGSVILGCHHEQDLRKMGGLFSKMPITAITMLIGVLAISGTPFFSGWYSKDLILTSAFGFARIHPEHLTLFLVPLIGAGLTAFYMFRLWFLAFIGPPRDHHVHDHAKESPWVMRIPLILLAVGSIGIAWGSPIWNIEKSFVLNQFGKAEPDSVPGQFSDALRAGAKQHELIDFLALGAAAMGVLFSALMYWRSYFSPAKIAKTLFPVNQLFAMKWYFDEIYNRLFVRPTVTLAFAISSFDKTQVKPEEAEIKDHEVNPRSVDGLLSAIGLLLYSLGIHLRNLQTGLIRRYVLVLVLTAIVMFAILSVLTI